jgi:hypothetical protein
VRTINSPFSGLAPILSQPRPNIQASRLEGAINKAENFGATPEKREKTCALLLADMILTSYRGFSRKKEEIIMFPSLFIHLDETVRISNGYLEPLFDLFIIRAKLNIQERE